MLGVKPRALCMLGKCWTTELHYPLISSLKVNWMEDWWDASEWIKKERRCSKNRCPVTPDGGRKWGTSKGRGSVKRKIGGSGPLWTQSAWLCLIFLCQLVGWNDSNPPKSAQIILPSTLHDLLSPLWNFLLISTLWACQSCFWIWETMLLKV